MRTQHKSKYLWTAFGTIRWKFRARWGHSWVGACNSCQKGSIEVKLECRSKRSYRSCFRRYNCICQHIQIRMRNYEWLPACVLALWWFSRRGPFASSAWWIICIVLSVIGDLYSEMFSCFRVIVNLSLGFRACLFVEFSLGVILKRSQKNIYSTLYLNFVEQTKNYCVSNFYILTSMRQIRH